jgi:hypothetical protein
MPPKTRQRPVATRDTRSTPHDPHRRKESRHGTTYPLRGSRRGSPRCPPPAHREADEADRQLARAKTLADQAENHPDLAGGTAPSTDAHLEGHGTQLRSDETGQISSETGGDNSQEAATTNAGDATDDANSAASMPDADSESVDPWASGDKATTDES